MRFCLFIGNDIRHVEGLEGLRLLRVLVLDQNCIKTLDKNTFKAQSVLLELHLAENRIRELNHLDPLADLRKLFLDSNKLQVLCFLNFILRILMKRLFQLNHLKATKQQNSHWSREGHSHLLCSF